LTVMKMYKLLDDVLFFGNFLSLLIYYLVFFGNQFICQRHLVLKGVFEGVYALD
jgi:hypothetical protein